MSEPSPHHPPEEARGISVSVPHHYVNYFAIFFALVVLTVLTVVVAFYRFHNEAVNLVVAMAIAAAKATLVAMFFMHLKFEGKLIYLVAIVPITLFVLLTAALIPDIILTSPQSHSASLHIFNSVHHLFMGAVGAE